MKENELDPTYKYWKEIAHKLSELTLDEVKEKCDKYKDRNKKQKNN